MGKLNHLDFTLYNAKNGQLTLKAAMAGKPSVYLHSSFDPADEAKAWASHFEKKPGTVYLVYGLGLGYHIEALLKQLPTNAIIVILHTKAESDILRHVGAKLSLSWFKDKRITLLQLINVVDMGIMLGNIMLKNMLRKVCICRHYPSMLLAEDEYKKIEKELLSRAEQAFFSNLSTDIFVAVPFLKNYWDNLPVIVNSPGIVSYKKAFNNLPVIVVASGPSLNKNIEELRLCQDRAVIIAAGTAAGALKKRNIRPDFIIVSDATFGEVQGLDIANPPVAIFSTQAKHDLVANYQGPKCFFAPEFVCGIGLENYFPQIDKLQQAISVTTGAVDFAVYAGAKQVILIGQDLAFPDNQEYAEGIQGGGYSQRERMMIDGYNGGEVPSTQVFKMVVDYYNQYVQAHPEATFINATEGGALISSMKNMPLKVVANEILPSKAFNKSFFVGKEGKIENNIIVSILEILTKAKQSCPELANYVQGFQNINEEQLLIDAVEQYRRFFAKLVTLDGYKYIAAGIQPHLDMLHFLREENLPLNGEYIISRRTKEILSDLTVWFIRMLENNSVTFAGFMENSDEK